ncbi:MAG: histidine phosphatase family protein [Thiohalobacteraceae bacterium]
MPARTAAPAELLILRHAKSDWTSGGDDFDRPLNTRGHRDAPRIGTWLAARGLIPDRVLSSPARRARQTVEAVCTTLKIPAERVVWDERLYLAPLPRLLDLLADTPAETQRLLLVGHNPGLEDLLIHLARDPRPAGTDDKHLPTAGLAHLRLSSWRPLQGGAAELVQRIRPRDLQAD